MGELIERYGRTMVDKPNSDAAERAQEAMSLIDDERVIPWYVKAVDTNWGQMRERALDRLCRFKGDAALEGIKKGMTTRGADMGFCSTPSVAQDAADAVRGSAAVALARSPHPKAKALLMTMHGDPYDGMRLTVIHALEGMDSTESLDLLRQMTHDGEKEVSDEAKRCLAQREMRSALTPALSPFAAKLVAAMPAGWKLTAHGTCGTPHRWTGAVTGEFLSFKHEGLRAVFPPGPASFTVSVIRSDYAGRLPKSDTTQPGGAYLEWVSPERLLFIEGSALQGEGQIALEKAFRSLGFDRAPAPISRPRRRWGDPPQARTARTITTPTTTRRSARRCLPYSRRYPNRRRRAGWCRFWEAFPRNRSESR